MVPNMASQDVFNECYRGRQTALHHMSYMRMAKVSLALSLLDKAGISLEGKSVFDYGFGAGTFFRYCPKGSKLFGVEIDPQNVAAVKEMLSGRGHKNLCLDLIEIEGWIQPLYTRDATLSHKLAQSLSLVLGIPATLIGHRLWRALGRVVGTFTFSKPTQAAFVLTRKQNQ